MHRIARYIEELSDELSHLAQDHKMHDLAYLLRMATEEARAVADRARAMPPVQPNASLGAQDHS